MSTSVRVVLVPFNEDDRRSFIPSEMLEDVFTPNVSARPTKDVVAAGFVPEEDFTQAKAKLERAPSS